MTSKMVIISALSGILFVALTSTISGGPHNQSQTVEAGVVHTLMPPPTMEAEGRHINTKAELADHWKHSVVYTSAYERSINNGTLGFASNIWFLKLNDGKVWFADMEPNGDRSPLATRLLYAAQISDDPFSGCGTAMTNQKPAPAQCFVQEKVFTWQEMRAFFQEDVKVGDEQWIATKLFVQSREW